MSCTLCRLIGKWVKKLEFGSAPPSPPGFPSQGSGAGNRPWEATARHSERGSGPWAFRASFSGTRTCTLFSAMRCPAGGLPSLVTSASGCLDCFSFFLPTRWIRTRGEYTRRRPVRGAQAWHRQRHSPVTLSPSDAVLGSGLQAGRGLRGLLSEEDTARGGGGELGMPGRVSTEQRRFSLHPRASPALRPLDTALEDTQGCLSPTF